MAVWPIRAVVRLPMVVQNPKAAATGRTTVPATKPRANNPNRHERANRSEPVSVTGDGSLQAECGKEQANGENEGAEKTKRRRDHREPVERLRQPEI